MWKRSDKSEAIDWKNKANDHQMNAYFVATSYFLKQRFKYFKDLACKGSKGFKWFLSRPNFRSRGKNEFTDYILLSKHELGNTLDVSKDKTKFTVCDFEIHNHCALTNKFFIYQFYWNALYNVYLSNSSELRSPLSSACSTKSIGASNSCIPWRYDISGCSLA